MKKTRKQQNPHRQQQNEGISKGVGGKLYKEELDTDFRSPHVYAHIKWACTHA